MKKQTTNLNKFILYGVNSIIGLTFLPGIGSAFRHSGNWIFLAAIFGAVLAFTIGIAYAWLAKYLKNCKSNIYSYAKLAFGYKTGFFLNWIQYITTPALLVAEMLAVVVGFSTLSWYSQYLWLIILISILLFVGLTALLIYGYQTTKIVIYVLLTIAILSMLFFVFSSFGSTDFFGNLTSKISSKYSQISFQGVITSFFTFFFAIGGIEYLASSSQELEDKENKIIKGIMTVVVFSLICHILFLTVEKIGVGANVLATSGSDFGKSPVNLFWKSIYGPIGGIVIIYVYIVINVIAESSARLSNGWLSARIIEPMAADGFFPTSWAKRNNKNQLRVGLFWQGVISLTLLLCLLIPLLFYPHSSQTLAAPFQIYSVIVFIQYAGVAATLLVLMHRNKIKHHKIMFYIFYPLFFIFVSLEILYAYSAITLAIGINGQPGDTSQWISSGASLGCILLAIPCYYIGKWTGTHQRNWKQLHN